MARPLRTLLSCLAIWLGALGPARAELPAAPVQDTAAASHQVLVLLKLPAPHFRPGTNYSDSYGDGAGLEARRRIANRLARAHGLTLVTSWPMPLLGVDCFVMAAPADQSPADVAAALAHDPDVVWSEPMHIYRGQGKTAAPNDPLFPLQPAARDWRLADLHELATGRNVRVAVIDSQVEVRHPDLAGQIQTSQDFAPGRAVQAEQHGTGVAGIIAAVADNRMGVAGVAPHARLMALRACWQEAGSPATVCDSLSLAQALHYAIDHQAQVINLSLGGPPDRLLGQLLDVAIARGMTVVGAVDPELAGGGFPASHRGVVAVTDDPRSAMAGAFLAPGRDVPTTQPGGGWSLVSGSSYAAAHVSGLFALLREHGSRVQGPGALVTARAGGGAINACATLLRTVGPCGDCACSQPPSASAIARR